MPPSRPVNQGQRSAQREPEFLPARGGQEADERLLRPASRAISSMGTPSADIKETNVWRKSRGAHPVPSPAASVILRNSRLTFDPSSGVPMVEANTRP
jgi:hypothetical protein